jgi:hypothetical protein
MNGFGVPTERSGAFSFAAEVQHDRFRTHQDRGIPRAQLIRTAYHAANSNLGSRSSLSGKTVISWKNSFNFVPDQIIIIKDSKNFKPVPISTRVAQWDAVVAEIRINSLLLRGINRPPRPRLLRLTLLGLDGAFWLPFSDQMNQKHGACASTQGTLQRAQRL